MHDLGDRARIEPRVGQQRGDAGHHALARIGRRGRRLVHVDAPVGQREHDVREGAADIDADARSTAHVRTLLVARPEIFASPPRPDQFFAISPKTGPDSRSL